MDNWGKHDTNFKSPFFRIVYILDKTEERNFIIRKSFKQGSFLKK